MTAKFFGLSGACRYSFVRAASIAAAGMLLSSMAQAMPHDNRGIPSRGQDRMSLRSQADARPALDRRDTSQEARPGREETGSTCRNEQASQSCR